MPLFLIVFAVPLVPHKVNSNSINFFARSTISFLCESFTDKNAKPYPGWPFTFNQLDNYGRKAVSYLPNLKINKANQVVQVIAEKTGEVIYTIRIKGNQFRPKVFEAGEYTIKVGEKGNQKSLNGLKSSNEKKTLTVTL